jgi:hypothetical protein
MYVYYVHMYVLGRQNMKNEDLAHDSYLSISPQGALLNRHMDERHEELKSNDRCVRSLVCSACYFIIFY